MESSPVTRRIVVVGGGAAGTAVLWSLARHGVGDVVEVVDPDEPGRGRVFDTDDPRLLCNTSVIVMSLHAGDRHDFLRYLRAAGCDTGPADFVPRGWFARYCAARHRDSARLTRARGATFRHVRARATGITRLGGDRYRVALDDGRELVADDVLVCPGTGPAVVPESVRGFDGAPNLYRSPFPTSTLRQGLRPRSDVLVLGTRLSAVDAAIVLCGDGHRVTLASRSGELPAVRTAIRHGDLARLDTDGFARLALDDARLPNAVLRLVRRATGACSDLALTAQVSGRREPTSRLRHELALAEAGHAVWQETVAELIDLVNERLSAVGPDLRHLAMHSCGRLVARYVSAMPAQNARLLLGLLDAGAAHLADSAPGALAPGAGGWWCAWPDGRRSRFDAVVCATGFTAPAISLSRDGVTLGGGGTPTPMIDAALRVRLPGQADAERIRLVGTASHGRFPIVNYIGTAVLQAERVADDMAVATDVVDRATLGVP